ncbi:MAG TPA: hypothetical protein PK175_02105 [Syntrophales bacterium]|jgi:hypothetical protein|nr:hypothetical protein [Syntrophales bacterium]HOU77124.1 hypothetical protein [Syntrophales bacterium]HPC32804.1 hypothetical protein [Syntrophales bacterium]HQG33652.1 hypothetical protein [Syntrophales bacterium]HQI35801.1 hypothetical protein [Syntrophales bacterium]
MLEKTLEKIADKILGFDEASLAFLWEKYKQRMEHFDASREWEQAVIVFFIINAVRAKNQIFNEEIRKRRNQTASSPPRKSDAGGRDKPQLKLIKPDKS